MPEAKAYTWRTLFRATVFLLRHHRRQYLFLYLLLALLQLHVLLPPYLLGKVVDFLAVYSGGPLFSLYLYTGLLGGAYAGVAIIRLFTKQALGNLRTEALYHAKVDGFTRLSQRSLIEQNRENVGQAAQQLQTGTAAFQRWLSLTDNELIVAVTSTFGTIGVLLTISPFYALFFVGYITLFGLLLRRSYARINALNTQHNLAIERASGTAIEGLSNILTLKATGTERSFGTLVASREALTRGYDIEIRRVYTGSWMAFQVLNGVTYGLFLLMVGVGVAHQEISAGQMVILFGYMQALVRSAIDIQGVYEEVLKAKASVGRMMEIFALDGGRAGTSVPFPATWREIEVSNVSYLYASGSGLRDISLTISKGERIGIIGPSGGGKSTLARLLIRILTPQSGAIRIGGADISAMDEDQYRDNVAVVLQECEVFNFSLRDNITLFRNVDEASLERAIKISALHELIGRLPTGLETVVGERGYELSGGERQRVGLARALCSNPQVLILDEATAALNEELEASVQKAIEAELRGTTIISVAHRLVTLKNVDRVYRISEGVISQSGSFREVVREISEDA